MKIGLSINVEKTKILTKSIIVNEKKIKMVRETSDLR